MTLKLYITDRQVPELSALAFSQRCAVREGAFKLLCQEQPSARWLIRLRNGLTLLVGCVIGFNISNQILIQLLVGTATTSVFILFYQSFLTEQLRPYFQRYLAEHRDEIDRIP